MRIQNIYSSTLPFPFSCFTCKHVFTLLFIPFLTLIGYKPEAVMPVTVAGYTNAEATVGENGESLIAIPIILPKGTILSPKLSIVSSSQGGDGIMGQSFSLSGLHSITRLSATKAQDNLVDGVDFDATDRFALNGERLMSVSGTYGANDTEYRTEQNSFTKVISYGSVGGGPEKYKAWTKDGLIMEFGYTTDSRIEAAGKSSVLVWLLNKVMDRKGNYMTIAYEENSVNSEYRPLRIDYTGNTSTGLTPYNSVKFIYEPRTGIINKYISGSQVAISKRLKAIETYEHTTLFRSYSIEYLPTSGNNAPRISKITECGMNNECFPATEFTWGNPQTQQGFQKTTSGFWSGHGGGNGNNIIGDFNGDGKTDMAGYAGNGSWHVCLSTGSGFNCSFMQAHAGGNTNNVVGDFNGDGKSDLAGYAGNGSWHVCLSTGSGFNCSFMQAHGGGVANNFVGDYNGDGKSDLAGYAGNGSWHVCLSTGSGFNGSFWSGHGGGNTNNTLGDFNGDGKTDMAGHAGNNSWHVCLSNGNGFTCSYKQVHGGGVGNNITRDFNGDGKSDMAGYAGNSSWHVCVSTGSAFNCSYWQGHGGGTTNNIAGDFNGDGKGDLAGYAGNLVWHVSLSNGIGFTNHYRQGHGGGSGLNFPGDYNGDGKTDMATSAGGANWHIVITDENEKAWATGAYGGWAGATGRIWPLDVNADGLQDYVFGPDNLGKWYVLKNTGSGFVDLGAWITGAYGAWEGSANRIRPMDVNADGKPDFVIGPDNSGKWFVLKNTGTGFVDLGAWATIAAYGTWVNSPNRIRPMDVDADGRQDIVVGPDNNGNWYVLKNTGSSFVDQGAWATVPAHGTWVNSADRIRPIDVNADGLPDIILGPDNLGKWYVLKNTGTSFVDLGEWISGAYGGWAGSPNRIRPFDVNGDGLTDIVIGPDNLGKWYVLKNTGTNFINEGAWITSPYGGWEGAADKIYNIDCTGDGLTDILLGPDSGNGKWYLLQNTGTSFVDKGAWAHGFITWAGASSRIRPSDVNGDGLPEMVFGPGTDGAWFLLKVSQSSEPSLVTKVKRGNDATTEFTYNPLTKNSVYVKGDTAAYPRVDFVSPLYVVSTMRDDNGVGGKNGYSYQYFDAKFNLHGRGFRGFGKTIQIDSVAGMKNIVFYERDHKCISTKVKRAEQRLLNNTLLSEVDNTIAMIDFGNSVSFSYNSQTVEKAYELNGAVVKNKTTSYAYDNFGNPTQITENTGNGFYTVTTSNTYTNTTSSWILGRLTGTTVTKQLQGSASITKNSTFTYDGLGYLNSETILPNHTTLKLQTDYIIDNYGNTTKKVISGPGITTREQNFSYDIKGRNIVSESNQLTQTTTYTYTNGLLSSVTDPNNLTTTFTRDGFGRETLANFPDGTSKTTAYSTCGTCPANAVYTISESVTGTGTSKKYLDRLDRTVREEEDGFSPMFNSVKTYVDYTYNADGTTNRVSNPYFSGSSIYWTYYQYDELDRVRKETLPGNRITNITYNGLTTTTVNPQNQQSVRTMNILGKLVTSTDHLGNSITFTYDSELNLLRTTDPNGNQIVNSYDLRGNKTSMNDPDMGAYSYAFNTLGLLTSQTNPAGQTTTFEYDKLNRITKRTETEGVTEWLYDPVNGVGNVSQIKVGGTIQETHEYNAQGKPSRTVYKRNGQDKQFLYTYNANGFLQNMEYPNGFKTKNIYNSIGFLTEVRNNASDALIWKALDYDADGDLTFFNFGNNLKTTRTYDATTGFLTAIKTGTTANPTSIQNLSYTYSALGNLTKRQDLAQNLTENLQYDNLDRLTQAAVSGQTAVNVTYDILGNITSKSDVGIYSYGAGSAGPHKLTSINHSGVPNCNYALQQNITYTSYNYPASITNANTEVLFTYGPNRDRTTMKLKKNGLLVLDKLYAGGLYEETKDAANVTTTVCHIKAGDEVFAFISKKGTESEKTTYAHTDHLGSTHITTNATGNIEERYSFDAWGKRRDPYTWASLSTQPALPAFQRGFTFHEHLDIDWLVCMNARVYNPIIGRFLSPDPFIQNPEDLQSYNRYSYVLNNPLSLTDPSGYFSLGKFFKENIGTIVGVAIGIATGGITILGSPFLGAIVSGASAGFGGSFTQSIANGGGIDDAFKAGLEGAKWGGISGGVTYGIATRFDGILKSGLHGLAQGSIEEARGGDFRNGFIGGFVGDVAMEAIGSNIDNFEAKVIASTIAGGTVSEMSGGKFANGALSAAFVAIYNGGHDPADDISDKITLMDVVEIGAIVILPFVDLALPFGDYISASLITKRAYIASKVAKGGGIQFGKVANQVEHTFRHTDKLGLDRNMVKSSIENHMKGSSSRITSGKAFNQVVEVSGQRIQYTAYKLPNGKINIGRIHGIK